MFGFHRRLVRRGECDTAWPKPGPFAHTSHTADTTNNSSRFSTTIPRAPSRRRAGRSRPAHRVAQRVGREGRRGGGRGAGRGGRGDSRVSGRDEIVDVVVVREAVSDADDGGGAAAGRGIRGRGRRG